MFAVHQTLADQRDVSFVGEIQSISENQAIVEDRKQDESRGCDEAIPSSIQCIHLKFWNCSESTLSRKSPILIVTVYMIQRCALAALPAVHFARNKMHAISRAGHEVSSRFLIFG
jgi:hypothetical protein